MRIYVIEDYDTPSRMFTTLGEAKVHGNTVSVMVPNAVGEYVSIQEYVKCLECGLWDVLLDEGDDHWDRQYCPQHRAAARERQANPGYLAEYKKRKGLQ